MKGKAGEENDWSSDQSVRLVGNLKVVVRPARARHAEGEQAVGAGQRVSVGAAGRSTITSKSRVAARSGAPATETCTVITLVLGD